MAFTTKKYTRPLLYKELRKVKTNNFYSLATLAETISPRTGTKSAKVAALRKLVGTTRLREAFTYVSFITKQELLAALKN